MSPSPCPTHPTTMRSSTPSGRRASSAWAARFLGLKIKTIYEVAPEPVAEDAPAADRVVIVVYEYTNNSIENGLVIGSTHFKAYDKSGKELELYPQANLFEAGEIHQFGTMTASIAFSLDKTASKYIEVDYYNDSASATPDLVFEGTWE